MSNVIATSNRKHKLKTDKIYQIEILLRKIKRKSGKTPAQVLKEFFIENSVELSKGVYILKELKDLYEVVTTNKLACGYTWFELRELSKTYVDTKNGLASTGDVLERVKSFARKLKIEEDDYQIITDIKINKHFVAHEQILPNGIRVTEAFDQYLNKKISEALNLEYGIEWLDPKDYPEIRSKEIIRVPRVLLLDFSELKRKVLESTLNEVVESKVFVPSEEHTECLNKLKNNTLPYFLLDCTMRFGKSFIFYQYVKEQFYNMNRNGIHVVMCHDTKTFDGWKTKARDFYSSIIDITELKEIKDFDFSKKYEKNQVILISPQLISSNSNLNIINESEKSEKKISELSKFGIKADTVFVDEAHQYFTLKWKEFYESIINPFGQIILASGTAANLKIRFHDLFDSDNTFTSTLSTLIKKLKKENNIDVEVILKRIELLNLIDGANISISNLQDVNTNGKLANPREVESFLTALLVGTSNNRNQFSPILSTDHKHFIAFLDRVEFATYMKEFIEKNCSDIVPILVAGDIGKRTAKTEAKVKKIIAEAETLGKKTITLSCGSMIQGISIREWKQMINLSSVSTFEIFYQLLGRGFEFDMKLDKDKSFQIIHWDYNPTRTLKVAGQFVESIAYTNENKDTSNAIKLFFDIHKIEDAYVDSKSGGSGWKTRDESNIRSEILQEVDKHLFNKGCKARLVTNSRPSVVLDMDEELAELCINTKGIQQSKKYLKKLKSYKETIGKQKTNYSISTDDNHNTDHSRVFEKTLTDRILDGLSTFTERIDIVAETMYRAGVIASKNVYELMGKSNNPMFIAGFGFPNKKVAKTFADYITRHGYPEKINRKLAELDRIPFITDVLDLSKNEFFGMSEKFDGIYRYGSDNTQLSVRDAYDILDGQFKDIKLNKFQTFHISHSKSGAINLALTYLLKEKSMKFFEKQLTSKEVIDMVSFDDNNTFFQSLNETMGFMKSSSDNKDFIIINPPYSSGLHLDIFIKSFEKLNPNGTLICIHRETPVITKTPNPNKNTKKYRDIMLNNTSEITFFDGNDVFNNADFFAPLIISRVTKDGKKSDIKIKANHLKNPYEYSVSTFDDVYIHSDIEKTVKIRDILLKKMKEMNLSNFNEMSTKKETDSPYYVNIKQLGGNRMKYGKINKDFYCIVSPKNEYDYENQIVDDLNKCLTRKKRGGGIRANSYDEALNIFEYLKTKFARFVFSLTKIDQNIWDGDMLSILPYLDFSEKWDDNKLFEYFNLTGELGEYINEYIEPIYDYEK